ncbi:Zinc finger DHHC-type palmitoyltransferase [Penicillium chermesinum]|uniref:Zinc finger DHHC-type palmitoyltransferase n=1 Tax=Penicillium chermesinum TaxID=63820 RepID=A0A9W9NHB9_9EURO|nr:Zinc finger DHHC-type palmitoyltransferase [Penicillium chermesinum]KAJ5219892.1 Zinc finger DHHC-type palmitoyltransferase [Penicillium chermesinum]
MEHPSDRPQPVGTDHPQQTEQVLGIPRPPSVGGISSRMTEMTSEDGERSPVSPVSPTYPPPPSTVQSRPSASRRGPPPTRASSQVTRPESAGSRLSRSHIPSLTAQGFFRPMSSQRLQAHRQGRPMTKGTVSSTEEWGDQMSQNRRSLISNSTMQQGSLPPVDMEPPPSRGTEFTDPVLPDRNAFNASPTGDHTVRSLGESVKLLRDRDQAGKHRPAPLNLAVNYSTPHPQDTPLKSPLSFLSLQNKGPGNNGHDSRGHERLSSAGTSPGPADAKKQQLPAGKLGKVYEYFPGNTIFGAGGRLQNARDKPINILTGTIVVLPSVLFFVFS